MKKKILSLCLIAVLVVTAIGGATLAYFTDTDKATNTFTVGGVKIQQLEQERVKGENGDYTEELQDFTPSQVVFPAVYPETTHKTEVDVNGYDVAIRDNVANYIDKIVSVKNTGSSDAYVRTFIAVPYNEVASQASVLGGYEQAQEWLHNNVVTSTDTDPANGWYLGKDAGNEYPAVADRNTRKVNIQGKDYLVSLFTNVNVLKAGKATAPCFVGFYLDDDVDCETVKNEATGEDELNYYIEINNIKYNLGDVSNLSIYAATQAVQTKGFDDAWTALDTAFKPFAKMTEADFIALFDISAS